MNITVEILSRTAVDQPFAQLAPPNMLPLVGDVIEFAPIIPDEARAFELRLRVKADDTASIDVKFRPGPAPTPGADAEEDGWKPGSFKTFGTWGGQIRDVPFVAGMGFRFRRVGVAP